MEGQTMPSGTRCIMRFTRLAIWIITAAGALAGQLIPRAGMRVSVASLAVLLILLLTTPPDAIRLPRWLSEILILGGSVAIQFIGHRVDRWWMLILDVMLLIVLRVTSQSAWWAALFAWLPV